MMNTIIITVRDRRIKAAAGETGVWYGWSPALLNTDDLALAARIPAVRAGTRRHLRPAADHCRMPRLAGQPLWLVAPVGSRFGVYPAVEIDLHIDCICAAQRRSPAALGGASRAPTCGTNLLPGSPAGKRRVPVQRSRDGRRKPATRVELAFPQPAIAEPTDYGHRRPGHPAGARNCAAPNGIDRRMLGFPSEGESATWIVEAIEADCAALSSRVLTPCQSGPHQRP